MLCHAPVALHVLHAYPSLPALLLVLVLVLVLRLLSRAPLSCYTRHAHWQGNYYYQ
jgi:hypothetical protein